MAKAVRLIAVAAMAASGVALDASGLSAAQDFEWSGRIAAGDVIEIKGVNGQVEASLASSDEVVVRAEKIEHRHGRAKDVRIEVVEHGDGVTICAVYPHKNGERENTCESGRKGGMNTHRNDTEVRFTVLVPEGVHFAGRTVNGDVEARGLRADARISSVNGDVRVETSGIAEATTVNGSVHASFLSPSWDRKLDFSTVNGSVTVEMAAGVNAQVRASTVNGSLESDFPLTVTGSFSRGRRLNGSIGDGGGGDLNLTTVNGSIRLLRRG